MTSSWRSPEVGACLTFHYLLASTQGMCPAPLWLPLTLWSMWIAPSGVQHWKYNVTGAPAVLSSLVSVSIHKLFASPGMSYLPYLHLLKPCASTEVLLNV